MSHALEGVELLDLRADLRAVFFGEGHSHAVFQHTAMHATNGYTSYVRIVVQRGDQHLRRTFQHFRLGYILDDGVHQRCDVLGRLFPIEAHPAVLCRTIDGLEVQLIFRGVEVAHQVKHRLLHFVRTAVEFIHFVDHYDRFEVQLDGFLQHEARLRHRPFEGIHQQQHTVRHVQHTLHLATEIRVPRSVDDVDLVAFVLDGNVLGEDRYTALALQIVVVEDKFALVLVIAEQVRRVQHLIDECRFAVIHVGDDCNVSNLLHIFASLKFSFAFAHALYVHT